MMYQERDSADPLTYGGVTASSDIDIGIEWRHQYVSSRVASVGMLSCWGAGI